MGFPAFVFCLPLSALQLLSHNSVPEDEDARTAFITAFQQLFWVTYRKGFPALGDTKLRSDSGWGCMIRTGQMAVAHALQRQLLGEGQRRPLTAHTISARVGIVTDITASIVSTNVCLQDGASRVTQRSRYGSVSPTGSLIFLFSPRRCPYII